VLQPGKHRVKRFPPKSGDAITSGCKDNQVQPLWSSQFSFGARLVVNFGTSLVTNRPLQTFREYGERFDIESEFLDEKSNGFQLEQSLVRSPIALSRLCLVLAIATLF